MMIPVRFRAVGKRQAFEREALLTMIEKKLLERQNNDIEVSHVNVYYIDHLKKLAYNEDCPATFLPSWIFLAIAYRLLCT